jgi:hypothetical protein
MYIPSAYQPYRLMRCFSLSLRVAFSGSGVSDEELGVGDGGGESCEDEDENWRRMSGGMRFL